MIYFDNAASTKVDESVLTLFNKIILEEYCNPNSSHKLGYEINNMVDKAREQILNSYSLSNTHKIIFTGSATESNNIAIKGYCLSHLNENANIITSSIEHPSVLNTFKQIESLYKIKVIYINPNENGVITEDILKQYINSNTILVSIMGVNNETGSINPIYELSSLVSKFPKCVFHCDATQAIGKVDIDYSKCDMITLSSHKIYGVKGVGGLILKKNINLEPIISGGGQEYNYRSGTLNAPGIISFARAIRLINNESNSIKKKVLEINKTIRDYLESNKEMYSINSDISNPYILNFSTLERKASVIQEALSNKGIMVSSVSACSSKGEPISYVLLNMGKDEHLARNSIRLSFGKYNTIEEAKEFIKVLDEIVRSTL